MLVWFVVMIWVGMRVGGRGREIFFVFEVGCRNCVVMESLFCLVVGDI